MPVQWDELERIYPTDFTLRTVPGILQQQGDPWADILGSKQDLGAMLEQRSAG
jgi:DNA primase